MLTNKLTITNQKHGWSQDLMAEVINHVLVYYLLIYYNILGRKSAKHILYQGFLRWPGLN